MLIHEIEILVDGVTTTKLLAVDETLQPGFQAVGCVDLKYKGRRTATIRQLFTRPAFRRHGIATALLERCLALASKENCEALSLLLAQKNSEAARFYKKHGFQLAWQDDDGELVMTRSLLVAPAEPKKLWPRREGMRQSIYGILSRLEPILKKNGDTEGYCSVLEQLREHLDQLGSRFYTGDMSVVDEFLQLYDLDSARAQQQRQHARKIGYGLL